MSKNISELGFAYRYSLALGSTALAALVRWILPAALEPAPYLGFYPAVVVSAALGGLGPGLAATFISLFLVNFVFGHIVINDLGAVARQAIWVTASVGVSALAEMQRRARRRERQKAEELRRWKDELELRVAQRMSELQNANQQLRVANEKLAQFDQAKTAFFSNVSHEFRTPLALMLGPIEEALRDRPGELPERQRHRIEIARRNGLRLQKLVNTLLDFSRFEAGRVEASFAPTDLAKSTTEIASHFDSACESAGLRLVIDCPPLEHPVFVDRVMWEKIVLNLLSNAFKFTLAGEIGLRLRAVDGQVELTVSDTGPGIPDAELPRIFERFHRIAGAQGRSFEGSGIGLALVQELTKLHGGEIWAESAPGVGSTFHVRIPLGDAHLPADRVRAAPDVYDSSARAEAFVSEALLWLNPATPEAIAARNGESIRPSVLLAEDNSDMRSYLVNLLEKSGYEVQAVSDGAAALAACVAAPPTLILTDVMMPIIDGLELTRRLRADERTAGIPILQLSARAGEPARIEGFRAGADEYIEKPFGARELIARIDAATRLARARTGIAQRERRIAVLGRVASIVETAMDAIISVDVQQNVVLFNAAAEQMFGRSAQEAIGRPLNDFIPQRFRANHANHVRTFASTGVSGRAMGRLGDLKALRGDGTEFPIEASISQAHVDGETIYTVIVRDISARIAAAETERLLVGELDHRVKNTLATVQAIALQTLKSNADPTAFVESFNGRLRALASAHTLLMRTSWQGAALDALVQEQLTLGPASSDDRIICGGPPIVLEPQCALHLGLVLHELGTNARKYGALSTPRGCLSVTWQFIEELVEAGPARFKIIWAESGGPTVALPKTFGFGSRLIERSLAHGLHGQVRLDYAAEGLRCEISLPLNPERC